MVKPDRITADSIVIYDAMISLYVKLGCYGEAVTNALDWFESSVKEEDEPEAAKLMRQLAEIANR